MPYKLLGIGYDFNAKSVSLNLQRQRPEGFAAITAVIKAEFPPNLSASELRGHIIDVARKALLEAAEFEDPEVA